MGDACNSSEVLGASLCLKASGHFKVCLVHEDWMVLSARGSHSYHFASSCTFLFLLSSQHAVAKTSLCEKEDMILKSFEL